MAEVSFPADIQEEFDCLQLEHDILYKAFCTSLRVRVTEKELQTTEEEKETKLYLSVV